MSARAKTFGPAKPVGSGAVIGHTGFSVARYQSTHVFGALFPLAAAVVFFGWRAMAVVSVVSATVLIFGTIWRGIGARGHTLRPAHLLWLAMVLSLMLPAQLASRHDAPVRWPVLLVAGIMLVIACWCQGTPAAGRSHPAVVVYLLLAVLFWPLLTPQTVLQRHHLLVGDVNDATLATEANTGRGTPATRYRWRDDRRTVKGHDAAAAPGGLALGELTSYADGRPPASLESVLRDRVPPLEDFALGAVPGGLGVTSAIAVMIGGLFLLYRGLIDYRIPLLLTVSAWVTLMVLPLPLHGAMGTAWRWLPSRMPEVGWATGATVANYQLLASPLLFTAFFLAGSPTVRPMTRRGRTIYAVLLGILAGVLQTYVSVRIGPYLALLLVGPLTPVLDKCPGFRPLV